MTAAVQGFGDKVGFIWSVADVLRSDFKAHGYGQVILPFTALRRLECALAPTKEAVVKRSESLVGKVENVDRTLQHTAKHPSTTSARTAGRNRPRLLVGFLDLSWLREGACPH